MMTRFLRTPPQRAQAPALILAALALASCDTGPQLFVDATREHDLEYVSYTGDRLWYLIDTLGSGLAAGDYDGDGDADLFLMTGGAILDSFADEAKEYRDALWRNDGGGMFTDVTATAGVGVSGWSNGAAWADYDGDGDLDLYVARHGRNILWRNDGSGTFTDVARAAGVDDARWGATPAFADFDGDGHLDLYVTNYADFDIPSQKGKVTGFSSGLLQFPQHFEPTDNVLYRNKGDGTFTDITEEAGVQGTGRSLGILAIDFDDDDDIDLFVANDVGFNDLFENKGEMRFENIALEAGVACDADGRFQATMGVAAGDYDGDGDTDIAVTNYGGEYHTLYRNDGDGLFTDVTVEAGLVNQDTLDTVGWGVGLFDFDLDGAVDYLSVNGHVVGNFVLWYMRNFSDAEGQIPQMGRASFNLGAQQTKHLFLGAGDGTFTDVTRNAGSAVHSERMSRGAAFADFDLDGRMDVAVSNKNDNVQILLNRIPPKGHWLRLRLRGPAPNRFAVGAKVRVEAGGRIWVREVLAGASYCSADELPLHFGLGAATSAERVEVRWPDGSRQEIRGLAADTTHEIVQGREPSTSPVAGAPAE